MANNVSVYLRHFIGRCDACGAPLYDDDERFAAELGNASLVFCNKCCKPVLINKIPDTELFKGANKD